MDYATLIEYARCIMWGVLVVGGVFVIATLAAYGNDSW